MGACWWTSRVPKPPHLRAMAEASEQNQVGQLPGYPGPELSPEFRPEMSYSLSTALPNREGRGRSGGWVAA